MGWAALAAWTIGLLFASPSSTAWWGLNGFRTVSASWPALIAAAAGAWALAAWKPRSTWLWAGVGLGLALCLALPLREKVHLLGDTQLRMRDLYAVQFPAPDATPSEWWNWLGLGARTLHASPLDMVFDVFPPLWLHAMGTTVADAVAFVDAVLAALYMGLAWRLARRLAPEVRLAAPLALALVLTGLLEAFAGYADSAGLIAVMALGWWSEILPPLDHPKQAWRATLWFAGLLLTHRIALVMLAPQLLRGLGPPIPGDQPAARRALLILTVAAVVLGVVAAVVTGAARQLSRDVAELLRSTRHVELRPLDLLSSLVVVAPLALAAPFLAGRLGRGFVREPSALWVAVGALPLLVGLAWVFPIGENGLGAHRDWDTNVLLGITLSAGAAALLARTGPARLATALVAAMPLLALTALGWVAVNADPVLATRRGIAMAQSPTALTGPQRANLHAYFGQRAMDEHRPDVAALHYQRAFDDGGNPRRALLAAEAWLMAGRTAEAREAIAKARAMGPLLPDLEAGIRELEIAIARADSVAADTVHAR